MDTYSRLPKSQTETTLPTKSTGIGCEDGWIIDTLKGLIATQSVNPRLNDDIPVERVGLGETAIAAQVARIYEHIPGVQVTIDEFTTGRANVIATLDVAAQHTILLETHLDTVEAADHPHPFDAQVRDGVIWGRGACDAKGQIVTHMAVLSTLAQVADQLPVNIQCAAVADEEHLYAGVRRLVPTLHDRSWVGAIIGEPTHLRPVVAHKGVVRGTIVCSGRAAHTSAPHEGDNAVERAADVIRWLREQGKKLPTHPLVGDATLTVTGVSGGQGPNIVPSQARILVDRRTIPGEDALQVWHELGQALAAEYGPQVSIEVPSVTDLALAPLGQGTTAHALSSSIASHGGDGELIGVSYGSDASKIAHAGIEAVVFGPGRIEDAHGAGEHVRLADIRLAVDIMCDAILSLPSH